MVTAYEDYTAAIKDPGLNSGLVRKCHEAIWKGAAIEFEGIVVRSMSMAAGLSKNKNYPRRFASFEHPQSAGL